jgi:hypothetical protein
VEEDQVSVSTVTPANDEIARVAHAIWEAEGQPEGRDHEHWTRAKRLIEEGRADIEYPHTAAPDGAQAEPPRPVQPGFEDTAPGMVPDMKDTTGRELREEPGGRFAKQLSDLPDRFEDKAPEIKDPSGRELREEPGGRFVKQLSDLPDRAADPHPEMPGPRDPQPLPPTNEEGYVALPSVDDVAGRALKDDRAVPETQRRRRAKGEPPV